MKARCGLIAQTCSPNCNLFDRDVAELFLPEDDYFVEAPFVVRNNNA